MMEPIAMPAVLNPTRPRLEGDLSLDTRAQQAHDLDRALGEAAGYGQHLWRQLDAVRHYLVNTLPDPAAGTDGGRLLTEPVGPDDEGGWERWRAAYEAVTSVLAGPRGDSGFGQHEAAREARRRRGPRRSSAQTHNLTDIATAADIQVGEQLSPVPVVGSSGPDESAPENPDNFGTGSRSTELAGVTGARRPAAAARVVAGAVAGFAVGIAVGRRALLSTRRSA